MPTGIRKASSTLPVSWGASDSIAPTWALPPAFHSSSLPLLPLENIVLVPGARAFASGDWPWGRAPAVTTPRQGSTRPVRCQPARSTKPGARPAVSPPRVSGPPRTSVSFPNARVRIRTTGRTVARELRASRQCADRSRPQRQEPHAPAVRATRSRPRGRFRQLSTLPVFLFFLSRTSFSSTERARSHQATGACGPRARSHHTEARIDATGAMPTGAVHKARSTPRGLPTARFWPTANVGLVPERARSHQDNWPTLSLVSCAPAGNAPIGAVPDAKSPTLLRCVRLDRAHVGASDERTRPRPTVLIFRLPREHRCRPQSARVRIRRLALGPRARSHDANGRGPQSQELAPRSPHRAFLSGP